MKNKAFKKIFIIGLTSISLNSLCYATEDINGNNTNGNVTVNSGEEYGEVSGYYQYADGSTQSSDIKIIGGGQSSLCTRYGQ